MKPYSPSEKLVIRDSLDDDLDLSDDVEDDVFIRDGRTCRTYEDKGVKRPLMAPRRKNGKILSSIPIMRKKTKCWKCCEPFCYGLTAIIVLIALIFLAAFILTMFPIPLQKIKIWFHNDLPFNKNNFNIFYHGISSQTQNNVNNKEVIPCTQLSVNKVWSKAIARLNSESPIRKFDSNSDGIEDIIIGYGIDDAIRYDDDRVPRCTSMKSGLTTTCGGGVMAINGKNGEILWQRWTTFTVFSIICASDLNNDTKIDCVAAGRGGLLLAINGDTGSILWELKYFSVLESISELDIDLYTINLIRDLDGDNVSEIIAVHVEEESTSRGSHIKLISGRTGTIIRSIPTPFNEEVYVPVQVVTQVDGTELLLIVTGGQSSQGGVYNFNLLQMMKFKTEKDFATIYKNDTSSFMVPAILTDLTGDSVEDIIISSFNSTIYAFNGATNAIIWSYSFPSSESASSIVPGHFDNDTVPDFMVKYNTGTGFPIYYYSQTTIISGATGLPLLDAMITDSGGPNSLLGGISISQTFGGDFYLHWQTHCRDQPNARDAYQFFPDSSIVQQSRADICMLRYNKSTVLKLYAISRNMEPPGAVIFSTDDMSIQLNKSYGLSSADYLIQPIKHPKMKIKSEIKSNVPEEDTTVLSRNRNRVKNKYKPKENKMINVDKKLDSNQENQNNFNFNPRDELKLDKEDFLKKIAERQKNFNKFSSPNINDNDNSNDIDITDNSEYVKPYIYLPYDQKDRDREYAKNNFNANNRIQSNNNNDYDVDYNEDMMKPLYNQRFRVRPAYLPEKINRDIRSRMDYESNASKTKKVPKAWPTVSAKPQPHGESLWDLEIEKEASETLNDNNFQYKSNDKREVYMKSNDSSNSFLPAIASNGILLESMDPSQNTIDFAFVLNIRESEIYPPLFTQDDLACVKEKLQAYKGYINEDLSKMEQKFLDQCLISRLPDLTTPYPQYEIQIVITRLSITCSCSDNLDTTKEVCSNFNQIDKQKWTEFMGNYQNGIYPN